MNKQKITRKTPKIQQSTNVPVIVAQQKNNIVLRDPFHITSWYNANNLRKHRDMQNINGYSRA